MSDRDALIKILREDLKAIEVSPGSFSLVARGEKLPAHVVFALTTEDHLMLSTPLVGTNEIGPIQIFELTQNLPFGISVMGENYVLKHLVTMKGMSEEVFRRELQILLASVESLQS